MPANPTPAETLKEAAQELLEVAKLRGDDELPHPSDDPKLWTSRMQTAWQELEAALTALADAPEAVAVEKMCCGNTVGGACQGECAIYACPTCGYSEPESVRREDSKMVRFTSGIPSRAPVPAAGTVTVEQIARAIYDARPLVHDWSWGDGGEYAERKRQKYLCCADAVLKLFGRTP